MPSFKKLPKTWVDPYKPKRKRDKFYSSKGWTKLRDQVLIRDGKLCQICKANDIITIVNVKPGDYAVDHIKPRRFFPDLYKEMSNLQTTCSRCHAIKSGKERNIKTIQEWYSKNS